MVPDTRHGSRDPRRRFRRTPVGGGTAVWFYLSKAILPIDLAFVYPQWKINPNGLRWWLPLAAAGIVTVVLWRYRKGWSRPLLFAWGFFCVALLPVLGFTDVGFMQYSLVADHYQHIALIGSRRWRRRASASTAVGHRAWSALRCWDRRSLSSAHWDLRPGSKTGSIAGQSPYIRTPWKRTPIAGWPTIIWD